MKIPPQVQQKAFEAMADEFERKGLRLEDHFRVSDEGMALSLAAAKIVRKSGAKVQGNASLEGLGLPRDGGFWHPLSETNEAGDRVNLWGAASLLVNAAQGWMPEPPDNPQTPLNKVTQKVNQVAPNVSVSALLRSARYSDADLLKLVGFVQQGLAADCAKASGR